MAVAGTPTDSELAEEDHTTTASLERHAVAPEGLVLFLFHPSKVSSWRLPLPGEVTVGRARDLEICVEHPSVSRYHLRVEAKAVSGGRFILLIEDLGSANGTRVHGGVLRPHSPKRIDVGEPVQLGTECLLTIHEAAKDGPSRAAEGNALDSDNAAEVREKKIRESGSDSRLTGSEGSKPDLPPAAPRFEFVVADQHMKDLYALAERIAVSEISVMILGETGAGKEMLARFIHQHSPRARSPFLALNCGGIMPSLLESELFGHAKGAFTGAVQAKAGLLESAEDGSLFLDEVGEMPLDMQVRLLRVIEERKIRRLGSLEPIHIRARFICATNRNLEAQVAQGSFRRDLYYRLNGLTLTIPPLRERTAEIPVLAHAFLASAARSAGHAKEPSISSEAMSRLLAHDWPGNIRQLKSAVECAFVLAGGNEIKPEHLALSTSSRLSAPPLPTPDPGATTTDTTLLSPSRSPSTVETWRDEGAPREARARESSQTSSQTRDKLGLSAQLSDLERVRILEALDSCAGNQTRAANLLGISRNTLMARLEAYGVPRPRKRGRSDSTSGE